MVGPLSTQPSASCQAVYGGSALGLDLWCGFCQDFFFSSSCSRTTKKHVVKTICTQDVCAMVQKSPEDPPKDPHKKYVPKLSSESPHENEERNGRCTTPHQGLWLQNSDRECNKQPHVLFIVPPMAKSREFRNETSGRIHWSWESCEWGPRERGRSEIPPFFLWENCSYWQN